MGTFSLIQSSMRLCLLIVFLVGFSLGRECYESYDAGMITPQELQPLLSMCDSSCDGNSLCESDCFVYLTALNYPRCDSIGEPMEVCFDVCAAYQSHFHRDELCEGFPTRDCTRGPISDIQPEPVKKPRPDRGSFSMSSSSSGWGSGSFSSSWGDSGSFWPYESSSWGWGSESSSGWGSGSFSMSSSSWWPHGSFSSSGWGSGSFSSSFGPWSGSSWGSMSGWGSGSFSDSFSSFGSSWGSSGSMSGWGSGSFSGSSSFGGLFSFSFRKGDKNPRIRRQKTADDMTFSLF